MELTLEEKQIIINVLNSVNGFSVADAKKVIPIIEKLTEQIRAEQPQQSEVVEGEVEKD